MMPPTAEWTTQVQPTCIPGMSEKPNPTVNAGSDATLKLGMELQDRVQRGLILPDKRPGAIVLMPIRVKREKLLDGYGKKAKLSVTIPMVLDTPSSYLIDANASRGRAGGFCALWTSICNNGRHKRSATYRSPRPSCLPCQRRLAAHHILKSLLGKKKALFFLPSSGQFTEQIRGNLAERQSSEEWHELMPHSTE